MENTNFKLSNYSDLVAMLNGLKPALQTKIIYDGLNEAGKVINSQAKQNLNATKLGKSLTNYSAYSSAFRIENLKARSNEELGGVKIGIAKSTKSLKTFNLRWIQWGTKKREYLYKNEQINTPGFKEKHGGYYHSTGLVKGTNFFYGAVKSKQKDAYNIISEAILESLEKNIDKFK